MTKPKAKPKPKSKKPSRPPVAYPLPDPDRGRSFDPEFAAKLRHIVDPGNRRPSTLAELSDSQLVDVYWMLSTNSREWTMEKIANVIQKEWTCLIGLNTGWVIRLLAKFSKRALGPRRGLAIAAKRVEEVKKQEHQAAAVEYVSKMDRKVREQLDEMVALGERMCDLEEEISYWMLAGKARGGPFENYVPKLMDTYLKTVQARHEMKKDYGMVVPQPTNRGIFRKLTMAITEQIGGDSEEAASFVDLFKGQLESIAEPVQITDYKAENAPICEQNGPDGEGQGTPLVYDFESEGPA